MRTEMTTVPYLDVFIFYQKRIKTAMMDAVEDEVLEHDDCTDEKKGFVRTSLSLSLSLR